METNYLHNFHSHNVSAILSYVLVLVKKQSSPATRQGGAWGERQYSSYSFTTLALDGVSRKRHAQAAFYPQGKEPWHPLDMRLGVPQSRSGHSG
jgi:hypothetical protein